MVKNVWPSGRGPHFEHSSRALASLNAAPITIIIIIIIISLTSFITLVKVAVQWTVVDDSST